MLATVSTAAYELAKSKLESADEYTRIQFLNIMAEMLTRYLYVSNEELLKFMPNSLAKKLNLDKNKDFIRIPIDSVFASLGIFFAMLHANKKYNARYKLSDMIQVLTDTIPDALNFFVTGAKITEEGISGASRQLVSLLLPQPAVPAFGLVLGKRIFPDFMDIEPKALQNLPAKYRFNNRTSIMAKWLGNKTNTSPMRLDYGLDQTFGQVGKIAVRGVEKGLYPDNLNVDDNFKASINIFKNLSYFASGRLIQDFYNNKRWTDELRNADKKGFELSTKEMNFYRTSDKITKNIAEDLKEYSEYAKFLDENKDDLSLDEQQKMRKDLMKMEIDIIKQIEDYNNMIKGED